MKNSAFLLLLLFTTVLTAQDTIYLDLNYKEILPENAVYFQVEDRNAPGEQNLITTLYRTNGEIVKQRSFLEVRKKLTLHGLQKTWYDNGQLYYQETYKKGKRHGDLLAYWEDGSRRRHDSFKNGKLKSGRIWNRQGQEEEHYPVMIPAQFPGGEKAIAEFLRKNLPVPESQERNTVVKTLAKIRIGTDGYIQEIKIVEGAPHYYNAILTQTLLNMPKWNPGSFMGEPIELWYTLPVNFSK